MPVTAPSWLTVDSLILRENITLLQMINKEPVKPTENNLASFKESADNSRVRAFTIEREKNLADCLAFLAATTDDPTKIVAVSIEEHVGGHGFTIRLAANSGELEDVLSGLRKIADELESFASNNRINNAVESLLRKIIALDRRRILTRLRSQHVKALKGNRDRPYLISRLARAFSLVPRDALTGNQTATLQDTQSKLKRAQKSFNKLEGLQYEESEGQLLDLLRKLISIVSCFPSQTDLWALLGKVENSGEFSNQSLSGLLIDTEKIRKYHAAAVFLTDAASGRQLFSQINVKAVSTLAPVPVSIPPIVALSGTLERLCQSQRVTKKQIRAFAPETFRYQDLYSKQMATSTPRVHAEIQLIFFYEAHPDIIPPRVISSSKDACFLCNLFIQKHGKYFTGATHGVVYERWALPETRQIPLSPSASNAMGSVVVLFNRAVEETILRAVRSPRKALKHPLESACRLPLWAPSAASIARTSAQHLDAPPMSSPHEIDVIDVTSNSPEPATAESEPRLIPKDTATLVSSLPNPSNFSNPISPPHAIPPPNSNETIQPAEDSGGGPDEHARSNSLNPISSHALPPPIPNSHSEMAEPITNPRNSPSSHAKSPRLIPPPTANIITSSPLVNLTRGETSHHQISPSHPIFLLRTRRMNLEFSWHAVSADLGREPSSAFEITIKYLDEVQNPIVEESKLINVDDLKESEDFSVGLRAEGLGSGDDGEWLYLQRKGETVAIKYSFADSTRGGKDD